MVRFCKTPSYEPELVRFEYWLYNNINNNKNDNDNIRMSLVFFVLQHFVVLVGMRYLSCSLGFFLGGLELLAIMTQKLQASLYVVCLLFASCSYNVLINNLL